MSTDHEPTRNILERIEEAFGEMDSDLCLNLRSTNTEYIELLREVTQLHADFPVISALTDGEGAISLSAKEREAFVQMDNLKVAIDDIERTNIYFSGQADCFAWLKRINAI